MTQTIGCQRCARFCEEVWFFKGQEMIRWIAENEFMTVDGDLEELYHDEPPDRADMTTAVRCRSCGQVFTLTVKGPEIDACGNRVWTWKPILRRSARS
ncbi:MAG: hypothetical protein DWQ37_19340 [Planctomycetota bacterium]|nr:MAG: hypothetical protein DWQ37_19340 [Planctomycetota bacterium]